MKTAIRVGGPTSGGRAQFEAMLEFSVEAEKLGVDQAWSADAWGMDAIAPLAYMAARTTRMQLGTGIMQLCARTPASAAMTAMSMDAVTNGHFLMLHPLGADAAARLDTLGRAVELVAAETP